MITGPNMGGKSTFLRQNALIVLLAHAGLRVPAKSAKLPLVDGIFARVGSGDVLAKNQSTFMTEMLEVSSILRNATEKSFIIFDELGRGTSTFDGMSLSRAIVQHLVENLGAKTLLATHYHELIELENSLSGVKNFSVAVHESSQGLVFLKKVLAGGASKSYGIHVARMAGIPEEIVDRAEIFLEKMEGKNPSVASEPLFFAGKSRAGNLEKISQILKSQKLEETTPLQALQILAKLQQVLAEK